MPQALGHSAQAGGGTGRGQHRAPAPLHLMQHTGGLGDWEEVPVGKCYPRLGDVTVPGTPHSAHTHTHTQHLSSKVRRQVNKGLHSGPPLTFPPEWSRCAASQSRPQTWTLCTLFARTCLPTGHMGAPSTRELTDGHLDFNVAILPQKQRPVKPPPPISGRHLTNRGPLCPNNGTEL